MTITQASGSDFTGISLAVLKGAKELLTDNFLKCVYVSDLTREKGQWICHFT